MLSGNWFTLRKNKMENVAPGKLYEYIGARKPIFGSLPDGIAKIVLEEYGASFITGVDDVESIKNTLAKLVNLFDDNKLPVPSEEEVLKYDRRVLAEMLTKEFQFFLRD